MAKPKLRGLHRDPQWAPGDGSINPLPLAFWGQADNVRGECFDTITAGVRLRGHAAIRSEGDSSPSLSTTRAFTGNVVSRSVAMEPIVIVKPVGVLMNRIARQCCLTLGLVAAAGPATAVTVNPKGAAYAFTVPSGFTQLPLLAPEASSGTSNSQTGIAPSDIKDKTSVHDLIAVVSYPLKRNADAFAPAALQAEAAAIVKSLGARILKVQRVKVAGRTAFSFVAMPAGTTTTWNKARLVFVFKGKNQVFVNCQWTTRASQIQRGCVKVLASMKIK